MSVHVCVCARVCLSLHEICVHARWLKCQTIRASVLQHVHLQQLVINEELSINFYWPWQELIFLGCFSPVCCPPLFCNFNQINAKLKNWQVLMKQESCHELAFLLLLPVYAHVYWCCFPADTIMPHKFELSGLYPVTLFIHAEHIAHCSVSPATQQVLTCSGSCATEGFGPYASLNPLNNWSQQPFL